VLSPKAWPSPAPRSRRTLLDSDARRPRPPGVRVSPTQQPTPITG